MSEEKELKCCECGYTAELIDKLSDDELLCEDCAENRALIEAENNGDFFRVENLDDDEFANLIERQEEIENGQA